MGRPSGAVSKETAAARQKRFRARRRRGTAVVRVEIDVERMIPVLIDANWLTEADAASPTKGGAALSHMLKVWAQIRNADDPKIIRNALRLSRQILG